MHFPGLGVNTKVVDIDKIYLNMRYETDPIAQFWEKLEKPNFSLIRSHFGAILEPKIWKLARICKICILHLIMIIYAEFEFIPTYRTEKEPFGAIRSHFWAKYELNQNFLENAV